MYSCASYAFFSVPATAPLLGSLQRSILDADGVVERLEYDPARRAHIALVKYEASADGSVAEQRQYILAAVGMKPGDVLRASRTQLVRCVCAFLPIFTRERRA